MRALAIVILLSACGGSNDTGGHCTLGNVCEEYGTSDLVTHEKDCKALTGTWSKGSCPSSDLVGTCITDKKVTRDYYKGGATAFTPVMAMGSCEHEFHGTWTAK